MRLCVVSGTFHPEPGGPSTFLYHLLPALQARGFEVRVITYGEPDAALGYPYPVTRISRRRSIPLRLLAMFRAILSAARRADAFFVSDYGLPVALANLLIRRPSLLKNVGDFAWEFSTRHGWIPPGQTIDQFQIAPHSPRVNLLRLAQRWYTAAAGVVVTPSRYSAALVLGWGIRPDKVRVIYNALDSLPDLPAREAARARLGLAGLPAGGFLAGLPAGGFPTGLPAGGFLAGPVVLTVARLTPWKGIAGLIRACARLRPSVRLIVVGDGPERAALEREAASQGGAVTFTGALPPDQVWLYLRAADVFALFSTYEGLPHTVLEAMQAGLPVVVSDAGGSPEVVTPGQTGWVVPAGDEAALAAALSEVLQNPELASARARRAAQTLDRFSWPRLVEEYETALRQLLKVRGQA